MQDPVLLWGCAEQGGAASSDLCFDPSVLRTGSELSCQVGTGEGSQEPGICCQNEDFSSAPISAGSPLSPFSVGQFLPNKAEVAPLKDQQQTVNAKLPLAPGAPFFPLFFHPSPSSCSLLAFDEHAWFD